MVKGLGVVRNGREKGRVIKEVEAVASRLVELGAALVSEAEYRFSSIFRVLDPGSKDGRFPAARSCSHSGLPLPRFWLRDMILGAVGQQTPSL